ncbi:hypothetical protein NDU88_004708 [Pleurodeles waltl]|uniref:Uncharacterized protein n=1 Tax=Pleurodeles waltl TaxID=8319 RepID=A0AAV7WSP5_PLEWA|nr:hypothetical protein NDU88_004708 [Pleurodeles waltl]
MGGGARRWPGAGPRSGDRIHFAVRPTGIEASTAELRCSCTMVAPSAGMRQHLRAQCTCGPEEEGAGAHQQADPGPGTPAEDCRSPVGPVAHVPIELQGQTPPTGRVMLPAGGPAITRPDGHMNDRPLRYELSPLGPECLHPVRVTGFVGANSCAGKGHTELVWPESGFEVLWLRLGHPTGGLGA